MVLMEEPEQTFMPAAAAAAPASDTSLLAREIQRRMKERGMTAKGLARTAELGPTYIYDIINGKSISPGVEKLRKIASALDCDLEDLTHPLAGSQSREPESSYRVDTSSILPLRPSEYALIKLWRSVSRDSRDEIIDRLMSMIPPSRKRDDPDAE